MNGLISFFESFLIPCLSVDYFQDFLVGNYSAIFNIGIRRSHHLLEFRIGLDLIQEFLKRTANLTHGSPETQF